MAIVAGFTWNLFKFGTFFEVMAVLFGNHARWREA